MKKHSKKQNTFWLKSKQMLCIALVTMGLLLGLNYEAVAQNTAYGTDALKNITTGSNNAAFGYRALFSNTTGFYNTANGYQALYFNTTGKWSTANGYQTLFSNTTGEFNTASGYQALYSNTTGFRNTATGSNVLYKNTTGDNNTAGGIYAMYSNTTGNGNVAYGSASLFANTTGFLNCAFGLEALFFNTMGAGNNAYGHQALYSNTDGGGNSANGAGALFLNTTGWYNTASGTGALGSNTIGHLNSALGYVAGVTSGDLTNTTAIGAHATVSESNTIQLGNDAVTKVYVGVGTKARLITGGLQVTGGTPAAGKVLTSDANGVATWQNPMGGGSGWRLTGNTGTDSTNFIGTTDDKPFNIRVNNQKAGRIDANNAFYGYQSGRNRTTGGYNTAMGFQSLDSLTTGDGNTAIGDRSLLANRSGKYNTAVGSVTLNSDTAGEYNTAIGYAADVKKGVKNSTAIGNNTIVNANNKIRLGDASITEVETQFKYTTVSDGRFKTNINEEEVKGLEFIKKLRPVVYNFDTKKFQAFLTQNMPADVRQKYMDKDFTSSTAIRQSGFIAQEVEKAAQEVGYDFNGIHKPENANDNYSLAYSQFVVPLVKAVQELDKKDEQKDKQIEQLQKEKEQQQQKMDQLQQQIDELKKMITGNSNTMMIKDDLVKPTTGNEIQVYPNPNGGMFNVVVPAGSQKMELIDMKGALIKAINLDSKTANYQLNLSGYAKGVYILNVWINGKTQTSKVIVQ